MTITEVEGSHVAFVTKPQPVVDAILDAISTVSRFGGWFPERSRGASRGRSCEAGTSRRRGSPLPSGESRERAT